MRSQHGILTSGLFVANQSRITRLWRDLRASLTTDLTDLEQLEQVCEFWSHAPLQRYLLNWDDPGGWPDAWSLIGAGNYDESAVSLAMQYTLLMGEDRRWTPDRLQLILATDPRHCLQHIMLKVDDRWLMNWEYLRIVPWDAVRANLHIHQRYAYNMRYHTMVERTIHRDNSR